MTFPSNFWNLFLPVHPGNTRGCLYHAYPRALLPLQGYLPMERKLDRSKPPGLCPLAPGPGLLRAGPAWGSTSTVLVLHRAPQPGAPRAWCWCFTERQEFQRCASAAPAFAMAPSFIRAHSSTLLAAPCSRSSQSCPPLQLSHL